MNLLRLTTLLMLSTLLYAQAHASVVITGTRLVYPAKQREITVKLNNNGTRPALVQAWVDSGDVTSSPTNSTAPFVLSPPVSRLDPSKGQSLRLMFTGAALPTEHESVFWLNVLDIPPKAEDAEGENMLQIAFRSRIKIFYRPDGLPGNPIEAPQQLQWKLIPAEDGYALQAYNPTAFHVSMMDLVLVAGQQRYESESDMLNPGQTSIFPVPTLKSLPATPAQVEFGAINDYGAVMPITQALTP